MNERNWKRNESLIKRKAVFDETVGCFVWCGPWRVRIWGENKQGHIVGQCF